MIVLLNALYKGGVGKTTQNVLLTHELAARGLKILFLDLDAQVSGTRFLTTKSASDSLFQEKNIFEAIQNDDIKSQIITLKNNIDYVAGNEYVNMFESMMKTKQIALNKQHLYFKKLLEPLDKEGYYDMVLLDMSPTRSVLNTAIMAAATHHIINSQSEVLSVEMIQTYLEDIKELQAIEVENISSVVLGISLGMKDNTKLSKHVIELVRSNYGELVFKTITERKSRIYGYSATGYPERNRRGLYNVKDSDALALHRQLTNEIVTRLNLPKIKGERNNDGL